MLLLSYEYWSLPDHHEHVEHIRAEGVGNAHVPQALPCHDHRREDVGKRGARRGYGEASHSLVEKYAKIDAGEEVNEIKRHVGSRNVGVGSQILSNLGVSKMRLLSSQTKYHSLSGFGLEVVEYIAE